MPEPDDSGPVQFQLPQHLGSVHAGAHSSEEQPVGPPAVGGAFIERRTQQHDGTAPHVLHPVNETFHTPNTATSAAAAMAPAHPVALPRPAKRARRSRYPPIRPAASGWISMTATASVPSSPASLQKPAPHTPVRPLPPFSVAIDAVIRSGFFHSVLARNAENRAVCIWSGTVVPRIDVLLSFTFRVSPPQSVPR